MRSTLQHLLPVIIVAMVVAACTQPAPTPPPVPTTVSAATPLPPPTATPKPTEPPEPHQIAAGENRFTTFCSGCHGGGFSTANLASYKTAESLYDYIRARMPPGNPALLSDQERYDVMAYLLSKAGLLPTGEVISGETLTEITWSEPTAPTGETQVVSGQNAFDRYCSGCHKAGYTEKAVRRYRTALGLFQFIHSNMPPGNPEVVSEQEAYDIVAYILSKVGLIKSDQTVDADTAPKISFE